MGLREGPDQLAAQLLGRLLHRKQPLLRAFCERIAVQARDLSRPWLRPLTASLRSPEALVGTLKDKAPVTALALLPDGRLASGSADASLLLWMPSGSKPAVIAKFVADAAIFCIAVSADGKTVIAGDGAGRVHFLRLEGTD